MLTRYVKTSALILYTLPIECAIPVLFSKHIQNHQLIFVTIAQATQDKEQRI